MRIDYSEMKNLFRFCNCNNILWGFRETPSEYFMEFYFHHPITKRKFNIIVYINDFYDKKDLEKYLIEEVKKEFTLDGHKDHLDALLYANHYLEEKEKKTMPPKSFYENLYITPSFTIPNIKKVIFNDPVTVVIWENGTKTIVRAENEAFDPEKGLAMAICKKALGTNKSGSNYYDIFKKWLPKEE